jgi:hypothetical protein
VLRNLTYCVHSLYHVSLRVYQRIRWFTYCHDQDRHVCLISVFNPPARPLPGERHLSADRPDIVHGSSTLRFIVFIQFNSLVTKSSSTFRLPSNLISSSMSSLLSSKEGAVRVVFRRFAQTVSTDALLCFGCQWRPCQPSNAPSNNTAKALSSVVLGNPNVALSFVLRSAFLPRRILSTNWMTFWIVSTQSFGA